MSRKGFFFIPLQVDAAFVLLQAMRKLEVACRPSKPVREMDVEDFRSMGCLAALLVDDQSLNRTHYCKTSYLTTELKTCMERLPWIVSLASNSQVDWDYVTLYQ